MRDGADAGMNDTTGDTIGDTIDVRAGESLDVAALRDWLLRVVPAEIPSGAALEIRQYPAGFSNLTYLLTWRGVDGERALVLRRPPHGVAAGIAHDMAREHGLLAVLHPLGVPVPRPVAVCRDSAVLGAPFYVMAHVPGLILRPPAPAAFTAAPDLPGRMATLSRTFAATLARLHAVPVAGTPLAAIGKPDGYVERQVQGWTKRWHAARTDDVAALDRVAAWLEAHRPPTAGVALVHNDFKLDNLVLDADGTNVRAILDWEMATIGDPLMDLGTTLAYWVQADDPPIFRSLGLGITALPGALSREALVHAYAEASGHVIGHVPFYHAFGLFKVAVIAQQIFARYVAGQTADPRFAHLGAAVQALGAQAEAVLRADVT